MQTNPRSIPVLAVGLWSSLLFLLIGSVMFAGCARSKIAAPRTSNPQRVALGDFVEPASAGQAGDPLPPARASSQVGSSAGTESPPTTDGFGEEITLRPVARPDSTEPSTALSTALSTGASSTVVPNPTTRAGSSSMGDSLELIEAKVGDINGKPIFTGTFFAPIEDRLVAEASRLSAPGWRRSAQDIIATRLNGIITDELLRAEALSSLTPTQRVGLQAFLNKFRDNMLSENLGSSQLAKRRIERDKGVTLDEALKQKEVDTLVQLTLIQEVNRRVNVSWRDIKQRYERDIDKFSPPPTATFRVIRAFKDDQDTIDEIQSQLDAGTDFVKVAAGSLNNFNTQTDGMLQVVLDGPYETTEFFGPEVLNTQAQSLAIGDSVGPIEFGSSDYWIKLMDIEKTSVSLYDAQIQIQRDLTLERRKIVQRQYLNRLSARGSVASFDEVLARLLEIAQERYGPKG